MHTISNRMILVHQRISTFAFWIMIFALKMSPKIIMIIIGVWISKCVTEIVLYIPIYLHPPLFSKNTPLDSFLSIQPTPTLITDHFQFSDAYLNVPHKHTRFHFNYSNIGLSFPYFSYSLILNFSKTKLRKMVNFNQSTIYVHDFVA